MGAHPFTYDARGLLATQTDFDGTYRYTYDEVGRNKRLEFPDGHARVQVFDDLGRITSRCYEYASAPSLNRCYGAQYDEVGNPVVLSDPEGSDVLQYDALDRLTKVTRKDGGGLVVSVDTYAFNALGALRVKAGLAVDHRRPRLDGAGSADAAVPATLDAQPVTLDLGGRVTALRGLDVSWDRTGEVRRVSPPVPSAPVHFGFDPFRRRVWTLGSATISDSTELYLYEGVDRIAALGRSSTFQDGAPEMTFLYDGVDHPLRVAGSEIKSVTSAQWKATPVVLAYYEVDLAGSVRRLRARGGDDLGGYRYAAFGDTLEDSVQNSPPAFVTVDMRRQPLRWKGMWRFDLNGTELYDARARMWSPALGTFLSVDEYDFHDRNSTLWGWGGQNPIRWSDPSGRWVGTPYQNAGQAGWAAGVEYNGYSIDTNRELAGIIFEKDGSFYHTRAVDTYGNDDHTSFPGAALPLVPKGGRAVGVWHTHANFTPGQNVCTSQPGKNGDKIFSPISPQDRDSLKKMIADGTLPRNAIGTVTTSSGHIALYSSQSSDSTQNYIFNDQFYVNWQGIRSDWHAPLYLDQGGRYVRPDGSTWP